jgi:hypothetical protein
MEIVALFSKMNKKGNPVVQLVEALRQKRVQFPMVSQKFFIDKILPAS